MFSFSDTILEFLIKKGLTADLLEVQSSLLLSGTAPINLTSAATIGFGISKLSQEQQQESLRAYTLIHEQLDILKFVPASGAATRMFKALTAFRAGGERCPEVSRFFQHCRALPFWKAEYADLSERALLDLLLDATQLGLADKPKGSIGFHRYGNQVHTPFREQMIEGIGYAKGKNGIRIHFTVPHKKRAEVEEEILETAHTVSKETSTSIDIQTSVQESATDTLCLGPDGKVLLSEDGMPIVRPGGHGALIENLNKSDADLIFIKNIDNLSISHKNQDTLAFKKILAGQLILMRERAREMRASILNGDATQDAFSALMLTMGYETNGKELGKNEMLNLLDRPYRVCGMVRNEGEPGGGPFWTKDANGQVSLQIVESAQMDASDPAQAAIMKNATHFNPVDIVCSTKMLDGTPIDLMKHRDMSSAFVTTKSVNGQDATVLEWPGLWNGAMADWNTLFVEVPLSTFNPVKTVNDLFRPAHQP